MGSSMMVLDLLLKVIELLHPDVQTYCQHRTEVDLLLIIVD